MAEALLNRLGAGKLGAESAGIEPGTLNPLVVEVLAEIGIDIAAKRTSSVADVIQSGVKFDCHHGVLRGERWAMPDVPGREEAAVLGLCRSFAISR